MSTLVHKGCANGVRIGLAAILLSVLAAAMAPAADVASLLTKARTAPLTGQECGQLAGALSDRGQLADWIAIARAVYCNGASSDYKAVAEQFRGLWVDRRQELAKLSLAEMMVVWESLFKLGAREDAQQVGSAWMQARDDWRQLPPGQLAELAKVVGCMAGGEPSWAKTTLREHVWNAHLSNEALFEAGKPWDYLLLADAMRLVLTPDQKAAVAATLQRRIGLAGTTFASFDPQQAGTCAMTLSTLSKGKKAGDVVAAWMLVNQGWKQAAANLLGSLSARFDSGASEGALAQREALASHIWATYLAAGADRSGLSDERIGLLVRASEWMYGQQQKDKLAAMLMDFYVGSPARAAEVDAIDLATGISALKKMKSLLQPEMAAAWMAASDKWKVMPVERLSMLGEALKLADSEQAKQQAAKLVQHVWDNCLSNLAGMSVQEMNSLLQSIPLVSLEQREAFSTKVVQSLAASPQQYGALAAGDVLKLGGWLTSASRREFVAGWMALGEQWKQADSKHLSEMALTLGTEGGSATVTAQRRQLADFVWDSYLAAGPQESTLPAGQMLVLCKAAGPLLSDERREDLLEKLVAHYSEPQVGAKTTATDLFALLKTLQAVGLAPTGELTASWMANNNSWKYFSPADLVRLASNLGFGTSDACQQQKEALYQHVLKQAAKFDPSQALILAGWLKSPHDQRAGRFVAAWMAAVDEWKQAKGDALAKLAAALAGSGESGKEARARLVALIESDYLPDGEKIRSVALTEWRAIVACVAGELETAKRTMWAVKLRKAFVDELPQGKPLGPDDLSTLAAVVGQLDSRQAVYLVSARAIDQDVLDRSSPSDLVSLAALAARTNPSAVTPALAKIETVSTADEKAFTTKEQMSISRSWAAAGNEAKCHEWAMKVYQAAVGSEEVRSAATEQSLQALAVFYKEVGLYGKGKSYPEFAAALAQVAKGAGFPRSDGNWRCAMDLAWLLGTPQTRATLQVELLDEHGALRPAVAKVVSFAYYLANDPDPWHAYLEQRLEDESLQGQERVQWLLIRAYSASLPGAPNPLLGKKWLQEAVALAAGSDQKLDIIGELAGGYAESNQYAQGYAFLEEVGGQFRGKDKERIEGFREAMTLHQVGYLRKTVTRLDGLIKKMEAMGKEAEASGKKGAISVMTERIERYRQRQQTCREEIEDLLANPRGRRG